MMYGLYGCCMMYGMYGMYGLYRLYGHTFPWYKARRDRCMGDVWRLRPEAGVKKSVKTLTPYDHQSLAHSLAHPSTT